MSGNVNGFFVFKANTARFQNLPRCAKTFTSLAGTDNNLDITSIQVHILLQIIIISSDTKNW